MSKSERLAEIVRRRREGFKEYNRLADYQGGVFECDYVSPYTRGACNLESPVMIMLQDWSSDRALRNSRNGPSEIGHDPRLATNRNLRKLLHSALGIDLHETYATNLFPFIKGGHLSTYIPFGDLVHAAKHFAIPQIEIISPKLVVCLGKNTFNALRVAYGLPSCSNMSIAIDSPFDMDLGGFKSTIWAQSHTGSWGQRNRNKEAPGRTLEDWKRMGDALPLGRVVPRAP